MATVSEIWVRVNADVKGLQSGLLKGSTELKAFSATANKSATESTAAGSKIGGAFSGVSSTLNRLAPAFIAIGAVAVGAIVKGISATTQWASEVRSLQRVTGQTAESASALAGAAAQLGIPVSQLTTGFGLLAKNIVNSSAGLTKYGIATRDASGQILPFDDVLLAISDKFNSLPTAMDKAAFAQNVFGKSGKNLIPILSQGSAGLAALEQKAKDLHLVMSQQALDDAKKLSLAERQLGLAFKGASISIGQAFIPVATTLVNALSKVIEVIAATPQPLKLAVLGFSVLTGAIAATVKIGGFFEDTWKKVLNVAGNTAQLNEAAQSAGNLTDSFSQISQELANFANIATAVRGSTIAATAPIAAMGVKINTEADAALAASLANTKFAKATSGLIVPTSELATVSKDAAGGIGATGAAASGLTIGGAVTILGALAVAGGFVAVQMRDAKGAVDQFGAAVATKIGQLAQGGDFAKAIKQQARQPLPTQAVPGSIGLGGGLFNQVQQIKEARQALQEFRAAQLLAAGSSDKLATSIRGILKPVTDLQTPTKDVGGLLSTLNVAATNATSGLDKLSAVSGQDFSSIRDDLLKAINDPKTTVAQLPAIFGGALAKVKDTMNAWHDSVVSNFGGASAALGAFLGQAAGKGPDKVSFNNLTASLKETQAQLHRWSSDFSTILGQSGAKAKTFLQDMSANGLQSIGILDVVAQQPKKIRDQFLKQYNDVNKQTDTIATQITTAFGKAADRIVLQLKNIVRAIQGLPPIKVKADTSQAQRAIHALAVALQGVKDKDVTVRFHQVGSVQHPLPFHSGGLVMHAGGQVSGLVDWQHMNHMPQFHAGGTVSWAHDIKPTHVPEVTQSIRRMHAGGLQFDEVPAVLQRGEFVVRKHAVESIGVPKLREINRMHSGGPVIQHTIERLHDGGIAQPAFMPVTKNGQMVLFTAPGVRTGADPKDAVGFWNRHVGQNVVKNTTERSQSTVYTTGDLLSNRFAGLAWPYGPHRAHIQLNDAVHVLGPGTFLRTMEHEMGHEFGLGHVASTSNIMNPDHAGTGVTSSQVSQIKQHFHAPRIRQQLHAGGLIDIGTTLLSTLPIKRKDDVPAILQAGEFVLRRDAVRNIGVPALESMNRMHTGGAVVPSTTRGSVGGFDEEALERVLVGAFKKALDAKKDRLYVDRKRFGRDLDQNVLTDGHW